VTLGLLPNFVEPVPFEQIALISQHALIFAADASLYLILPGRGAPIFSATVQFYPARRAMLSGLRT
jgi:hypothetical protein